MMPFGDAPADNWQAWASHVEKEMQELEATLELQDGSTKRPNPASFQTAPDNSSKDHKKQKSTGRAIDAKT